MTDKKASSSYIPLQERDQWSDLTPIEQDDGPTPLVPIMYSEECELSYRGPAGLKKADIQTAMRWIISEL